MLSFEEVRALARELPEIEDGTSYGTPALKVRKKLVCRLWGPRELARDEVDEGDVIMARCSLEAKEALLAHPATFDSPHYRGHGAVAVRLAQADEAFVAELLEHSYRQVAPKRLLRKLDEG